MIATAFLAIGLVLVVEGMLYALAPGLVEEFLRLFRAMPIEARRLVGLTAIVIGVLMIWGAKMLGAAL